jgi:formamidopyrimidine-DNA glycosylase
VPELPEVEYVRRLLRVAMDRARIERVIARRPTLRYPLGSDFAARLEGQTVRAVSRRAKYLVVELASGESLVMHLGMSGWFRVLRRRSSRTSPARAGRSQSSGTRYYDQTPLELHDHVVFEMSSGASVIFNDPRRFGFMKVLTAEALAADPALSILGPEPLDRTFTADVLAARLKGKKGATLKAALLDQRVIAGLGNIYVSEALHRAALSPTRKAATLVTRNGQPAPRAFALVDAIKATLRDAIANRHRAGGADRFFVYDHEGRRCPRRGCPGTIKRRIQLGRSTFFCPVCQR